MSRRHPTPEEAEAAKAFVWTTANRRQIHLDAMETSHLVKLRRHLRRRKSKLAEAQDEFFMSQIDPKMTSSLSGLEDAIAYIDTALSHVLVEVQRRLIARPSPDEAQMLGHEEDEPAAA